MIERENVAKGLEILLNGCDDIQCEDCCFHIKDPCKPRRCGLSEDEIHEQAFALLKEQKSIIPWLSELMLNTNDEPIKPSEVIRRIEEGGLKRFAEEESQ